MVVIVSTSLSYGIIIALSARAVKYFFDFFENFLNFFQAVPGSAGQLPDFPYF
jgi:hypothetical protein